MPKAIVLTQYCAPDLPIAPIEPRPASSLGATGAHRRRYRLLEQPRSPAIVDYLPLWNLDRDALAAALPRGVARYVCIETQDSGAIDEAHRVLMIVAFDVPAARSDELERWYREEHGPLLLRAPGWLRTRRYEPISITGGPRWTHLALHELRGVEVLDSPERAHARSTPWRARLEQESWFAHAGRFVYEYLP
jgi:hypothetical protein